ncbi:MAG TPA: phosphoadenylyl-sulfate reductase [Burkholderiales bacterium]|nr:phosphoadenylyl-sulfate reductase [Burkholderiales bacterium]
MTQEAKIRRAKALLKTIESDYAPAVFANSLGAEDMVLTDLIASGFPAIEIFSLDTGRLPEETYKLMNEVKARYGIALKVYFPQAAAVEEYVAVYGPNGFYDSVELRKRCCHMRKVEPLKRALHGKRAWITGLRREQSVTRNALQESEFDAANGLQKFSPLADWTRKDVWAYIREHDIPHNSLHDQGYASIGCAPCTRAIAVGEDERAGRWWWEHPKNKECGLHVKGRIQDSGVRIQGPVESHSRGSKPASSEDETSDKRERVEHA